MLAFLNRLFRRQPAVLSGKTLVLFSDGRVALADSREAAQAFVMNECLKSGGVVMADFRPATQDEVAALTA